MKYWHSRHNPLVILTQHEMLRISREISQEFAPEATINAQELVLMPVDPYHLYAYWNLAENKSDRLPYQGMSDDLALRVYWRPQESLQLDNSKLWFDVAVQRNHNQQKIRLPMDATAYSAAIGAYFSGHEFIPYATSNIIHVPSSRVALPEPELAAIGSNTLLPDHKPGKESNLRENVTHYYDEALFDAKIKDSIGRQGINSSMAEEVKSIENVSTQSTKGKYYDELLIDVEIKGALYAKGIDFSFSGIPNNSEKSHYASKNASGQGNIN